MIRRDYDEPQDLGVASDQLAFIIMKARAFDAEVEPTDPDEGSNGQDDRMVDVLEGTRDNPNARELHAAIRSLDVDGQAALVALTWISRGDYEPEEFEEARRMARERHDGSTARYLMGMPMLGDLLEDAADKLNVNLTRDEQIGMHHPATETPSENDRD
jgi:hypothetical protein